MTISNTPKPNASQLSGDLMRRLNKSAKKLRNIVRKIRSAADDLNGNGLLNQTVVKGLRESLQTAEAVANAQRAKAFYRARKLGFKGNLTLPLGVQEVILKDDHMTFRREGKNWAWLSDKPTPLYL